MHDEVCMPIITAVMMMQKFHPWKQAIGSTWAVGWGYCIIFSSRASIHACMQTGMQRSETAPSGWVNLDSLPSSPMVAAAGTARSSLTRFGSSNNLVQPAAASTGRAVSSTAEASSQSETAGTSSGSGYPAAGGGGGGPNQTPANAAVASGGGFSKPSIIVEEMDSVGLGLGGDVSFSGSALVVATPTIIVRGPSSGMSVTETTNTGTGGVSSPSASLFGGSGSSPQSPHSPSPRATITAVLPSVSASPTSESSSHCYSPRGGGDSPLPRSSGQGRPPAGQGLVPASPPMISFSENGCLSQAAQPSLSQEVQPLLTLPSGVKIMNRVESRPSSASTTPSTPPTATLGPRYMQSTASSNLGQPVIMQRSSNSPLPGLVAEHLSI